MGLIDDQSEGGSFWSHVCRMPDRADSGRDGFDRDPYGEIHVRFFRPIPGLVDCQSDGCQVFLFLIRMWALARREFRWSPRAF